MVGVSTYFFLFLADILFNWRRRSRQDMTKYAPPEKNDKICSPRKRNDKICSPRGMIGKWCCRCLQLLSRSLREHHCPPSSRDHHQQHCFCLIAFVLCQSHLRFHQQKRASKEVCFFQICPLKEKIVLTALHERQAICHSIGMLKFAQI